MPTNMEHASKGYPDARLPFVGASCRLRYRSIMQLRLQGVSDMACGGQGRALGH
jgi:hypothetical protein